ncbi:MAG: hypothetical protein V1792_07660 [Pseudomonadota bacterium]
MQSIKVVIFEFLMVLVLLSCIQMHAAQAGGTTIFRDDFEKGTDALWDHGKGVDVVSHEGNNRLRMEGQDCWATPRGPGNWSNYTLGVGVQLVEGTLSVCVMKTAKGEYQVFFNDKGITLGKWVNDGSAPDPSLSTTPSEGPYVHTGDQGYQIANLATSGTGLTPGNWHFVEVSAADGHIQVYVDKELKMEYLDPNPQANGKIEVAVGGSEPGGKGLAYFDEVTVASAGSD